MFKRDLTFLTPLMNAAGMLGFAPDFRQPLPWEALGAFVTNPISLEPHKPATKPTLLEYPGGFLLHTGLPNPGLRSVSRRFASRWADSPLPVIVHLMAAAPGETAHMVQSLEGLENVIAVEVGFPAEADSAYMLETVSASQGELPVIVSLPHEQVLNLGPGIIQAGAAAVSLSAPRGTLPGESKSGTGTLVSGRLYGPALLPKSLEVVKNALKLGLPVIGAGGVYSKENASAMLSAGALAVQIDTVLWRSNVETF